VSIAMVNQAPVAVYREEQWFPGWIYTILLGSAILAFGALLWVYDPHHLIDRLRSKSVLCLALGVGLSLPPMLVVGFLKMTTEVHPGELRIWFGLLPTYRHVVPLTEIRSVEPVRYRPLVDCGGWGFRRGRHGERVFTARGDLGVRLTLKDGSTLLVGSQRPEELAGTIDRAVRDLS
jgi:membrane protein YdbS with pleckstrin-like domain